MKFEIKVIDYGHSELSQIKIQTHVTHVRLIDLLLQIPCRCCAFRAQITVRDISRSGVSMVRVVVSKIAKMMMKMILIMPPIATRRSSSIISSVMSMCMQVAFFHGRLFRCRISLLSLLFKLVQEISTNPGQD